MARCLSAILLLWCVLIGCLHHVRSLSNITCFTCNNCPAVTSETSRTFCSELLAARLEPYCITTTTNDGAIHRGCGKPNASFQDGCRNHTNDVTMEMELVCGCDQSECNGAMFKIENLLKDDNQTTTQASDESDKNQSTTIATDQSNYNQSAITKASDESDKNQSTTIAMDQSIYNQSATKAYDESDKNQSTIKAPDQSNYIHSTTKSLNEYEKNQSTTKPPDQYYYNQSTTNSSDQYGKNESTKKPQDQAPDQAPSKSDYGRGADDNPTHDSGPFSKDFINKYGFWILLALLVAVLCGGNVTEIVRRLWYCKDRRRHILERDNKKLRRQQRREAKRSASVSSTSSEDSVKSNANDQLPVTDSPRKHMLQQYLPSLRLGKRP